MIPGMDDIIELWPIPRHRGITIDSKLLQEFDLEWIRDLLLGVLEKDFEPLTPTISVLLVRKLGNDSSSEGPHRGHCR